MTLQELQELCNNIQNWVIEEYTPKEQKLITDTYNSTIQKHNEEYINEKISEALLNIHKEDTEQHNNCVNGEWKVYRIKEIGQYLNDSLLEPKWNNYTYLYPEVYLTKEAAINHKPYDLHSDKSHSTYEIIEQIVIDK